MKMIHLFIVVAAAVCSLSSCAVDPYWALGFPPPHPVPGYVPGPPPPRPLVPPTVPAPALVRPWAPDSLRSPAVSDALRSSDVRTPAAPPRFSPAAMEAIRSSTSTFAGGVPPMPGR